MSPRPERGARTGRSRSGPRRPPARPQATARNAELLAKFEEGTKLLKVCESRLKDAELKIEQLKKQKDGTVTFEKFEASRED